MLLLPHKLAPCSGGTQRLNLYWVVSLRLISVVRHEHAERPPKQVADIRTANFYRSRAFARPQKAQEKRILGVGGRQTHQVAEYHPTPASL